MGPIGPLMDDGFSQLEQRFGSYPAPSPPVNTQFPGALRKSDVPSDLHEAQLMRDVFLTPADPVLRDTVGTVQENAASGAGDEYDFSLDSGPGLLLPRSSQLGSLDVDKATHAWDASSIWREPASGAAEAMPQLVTVPGVQPTNSQISHISTLPQTPRGNDCGPVDGNDALNQVIPLANQFGGGQEYEAEKEVVSGEAWSSLVYQPNEGIASAAAPLAVAPVAMVTPVTGAEAWSSPMSSSALAQQVSPMPAAATATPGVTRGEELAMLTAAGGVAAPVGPCAAAMAATADAPSRPLKRGRPAAGRSSGSTTSSGCRGGRPAAGPYGPNTILPDLGSPPPPPPPPPRRPPLRRRTSGATETAAVAATAAAAGARTASSLRSRVAEVFTPGRRAAAGGRPRARNNVAQALRVNPAVSAAPRAPPPAEGRGMPPVAALALSPASDAAAVNTGGNVGPGLGHGHDGAPAVIARNSPPASATTVSDVEEDGEASDGDLGLQAAGLEKVMSARQMARIEHWRRCRAKINERLLYVVHLLPAPSRPLRHKADLLTHATEQVVRLLRANTRLELELATRTPDTLYTFLRDRVSGAATLIEALEPVLQLSLGPSCGWAAAEVWEEVPAVVARMGVRRDVTGGVRSTQGTRRKATTTATQSDVASGMPATSAATTPATAMRVVWARFADATGTLGGTTSCSSDKTGCICGSQPPPTAVATSDGAGGGGGDGGRDDEDSEQEYVGGLLWVYDSPTARALRRAHRAAASAPGVGRSAEVEAAACAATASPFPRWHSRDAGGATSAAATTASAAAAAAAGTAPSPAPAPVADATAAATAAAPVAADVAASLTIPVPSFTPAFAASLAANPLSVASLLSSAMTVLRAAGQNPSSAAEGAICGGGHHPPAVTSSPAMPVADGSAAADGCPVTAAYTGAAAVIVLTDVAARAFDSRHWQLFTCMAWVVGATWATNPASAASQPAGGATAKGGTAGSGRTSGIGNSRSGGGGGKKKGEGAGGKRKGGVVGVRRARGVPPTPTAAGGVGNG